MEKLHFKRLFDNVATIYGFERAHGFWYKELDESIAALDLQKSNYSNLYYLNAKIHVTNAFGKAATVEKEMLKMPGTTSTRVPAAYSNFFDLDDEMSEIERKEGLNGFFIEYLGPWIESGATKIDLLKSEKHYLTPAVRRELQRLVDE